ncbi:MAG: MerR family transcriptional regulator [Candidatus Nanopelagicaceae bacterium]|jgi:DNA-binding transcriptional MerR regulator
MATGANPAVAKDESLTVAAVARRLGVAPATLRTWDRRYGLGPSGHTQGEHRRYNSLDLARLTLMRKLVIAGMPPSQAAEQALTLDDENISKSNFVELLPQEFEVREELVDSLMRAAQSMDRTFIYELLEAEIRNSGIINAWSEVIVPCLMLIGDEWAVTGTGIEVEHMFSEIVKSILQNNLKSSKDPRNSRPVLLACIGEETHSLALFALQVALSELNVEAQFLGARTPLEAIVSTVKRSAPPAIFLWAQLERHGDVTLLADIPSVRPTPRIVLGGPGWFRDDVAIPSSTPSKLKVVHVEDLPSAVAEIMHAIGD